MRPTILNLSVLCLTLSSLFLISCESEDISINRGTNESLDNFGPFVNTSFAGEYTPTGEGYNEIEENPWVVVAEEPQSTFSIDADGGAYANARRFLNNQELPPKDAIRTEEFINYFPMDYQAPINGDPISLNGELAQCPWSDGNLLLRVGIQGKEILKRDLPPANFVFLIDVSGSMGSDNKLPLLKESFKLFTDFIGPDDRISIVTYAGSSAVVLPSTSGSEKVAIKTAIESLGAGGGTAGAQGIITAYDIATDHFITGGNNRVIIGTDGDFNIGVSSQEELVSLIEEKRELGVFLTVLGVGTGNYQDGKMEQLANNGNGTYEYIDNLAQAKKVFIDEFGKFYTVAKDVKVQLTFKESQIKAYRLIGYENRLLENQDFEDDTKDAGEIGAGQSITALYELQPATLISSLDAAANIDFRYKLPDGTQSTQISLDMDDNNVSFENASENTRFTAVLAGFGMLLRESPYKGTLNWEDLENWAANANTFDPNGYRQELIQLIETAKNL